MGYTHATAIGYYATVFSNDFIMDNVMCMGDEVDILTCPYVSVHNCGTSEGARVYCGSTTLDEGMEYGICDLF